jgi:hypothetical protein
VAAMKRAPEELEERSPLAQIVYSHCLAAQAASSGTASRLGCKSWQDIVNEKESPRERRSAQRNFVVVRPPPAGLVQVG